MLRALGAFLDDEPSCRISLAEGPDGFLVRLQGALHKLEPKVLHIDQHALVEQLERLLQRRKPAGTRARHQGIWAHFPNGHQDFLRALGYELDQAAARSILIDELEDGIVVSYNSPAPEAGAWRRRMVILDLPQIEEVLNAAFARRRERSDVRTS
jgi:hypothetical protein